MLFVHKLSMKAIGTTHAFHGQLLLSSLPSSLLSPLLSSLLSSLLRSYSAPYSIHTPAICFRSHQSPRSGDNQQSQKQPPSRHALQNSTRHAEPQLATTINQSEDRPKIAACHPQTNTTIHTKAPCTPQKNPEGRRDRWPKLGLLHHVQEPYRKLHRPGLSKV